MVVVEQVLVVGIGMYRFDVPFDKFPTHFPEFSSPGTIALVVQEAAE